MNERLLKEDILKILRVLSSGQGVSQRDLSSNLGVSLGKINYLLRALTAKGLVKIKSFSTQGQKLKKVKYILTPQGLDEKLQLTYYFLKRKEAEYRQLKKEAEEAEPKKKEEKYARI